MHGGHGDLDDKQKLFDQQIISVRLSVVRGLFTFVIRKRVLVQIPMRYNNSGSR